MTRDSAFGIATLVAACLLVGGCVTTETTNNAGAGLPGASGSSKSSGSSGSSSAAGSGSATGTGSGSGGQQASRDAGTSPLNSATSPNEEIRRRAKIRLELAANHYQQQNYPLALQEADQSVNLDPAFSAGYGMLGLIYMAIGDRAKADQSFNRAISLDPKDAELNNNFGWYLCQTGRQRESLAYFNKALEDRLYATPAKPLHNAGICVLQTGDEAGAESYFLRSFQVDPANAVAMYNLAQLYLKQRNLDRAKFYSDRLMNSYQPTAETVWLALRVARASGNRDYAGQLASQLSQRFPASREAALLQRGAFGD
jgi:type IV pilus assembly protein PilF